MASSRIAFGSILATVSDTANAVSSIVNSATKSVGMLDTLVTEAATNQRIRAVVDREVFVDNLIRDSAMEAAEAGIKIEAFASKSPAHAELYTKAHSRFELLLNSHRPKPQGE